VTIEGSAGQRGTRPVTIGRKGTALRHVHTLFSEGTVAGLTDGQLLERFAKRDAESAELAFAALVERHGPMVLRVCRAVLLDGHEAQDAFQATFLVLVRKAGSLRVRDSLGPWLHEVALRIAACARATIARRRVHERRCVAMAERSSSSRDEVSDDQDAILHEEVGRLPEGHRKAVVLCDLEGLSHEEAARQLGWPIGTVKSRQARGRARLRDRLIRRGLAPMAAALASVLSEQTAKAIVPAVLAESMVQLALRVGLGKTTMAGLVSAPVLALVEGGLRMMMLSRVKPIAMSILATALMATGIAVVTYSASGTEGEPALRVPLPDRRAKEPGALATTEFFSAGERAGSFAYVIDRSGSMATGDALDVAKRELWESLGKLTHDVRFAIVFFNLSLTFLSDARGHPGMMTATDSNKACVRTQLDAVTAESGTDQVLALRAALAEQPEVIYFLTDTDLMPSDDVKQITAEAGKTRIHVAEFGRGAERGGDSPLRRLAANTGGTYRYFEIAKLPKR
jgi:RNA polymerase sigma factor (sigma-70 family)